jgi:hypothetical protein
MRRRDIVALTACPLVPLATPTLAAPSGPEPIATAPRAGERTLLLYCPEQAGWQTGEWCEGQWVSTADIEIVLEPTHWTDVPEPPKET